jgi:hypothetical protein
VRRRARLRFGRLLAEVLRDDLDHRHERHGEERTEDPGDQRPGTDAEDDGQRVDRHGPAHQEGLQQVRLDLRHEDPDGVDGRDDHPSSARTR